MTIEKKKKTEEKENINDLRFVVEGEEDEKKKLSQNKNINKSKKDNRKMRVEINKFNAYYKNRLNTQDDENPNLKYYQIS